MPTAVVSGAAGFLGSHMCDALISEGINVIGLDNLSTGSLDNVSHLSPDSFELLEHDVSNPINIDGEVDYVLHLASPASPEDFDRLAIQIMKVGALGTHNMLGLAMAKGARFLLASTSEVYGNPEVHPQPESYWGNVNSLGPRGVYDEAKRYAEALTMAYERQHKVDVCIARIFNTYGPRMRADDGRVVTNFVSQALQNKPLSVYGDGKQTRCFCFVDDQIEGLLVLLKSGEQGPINVGADVEVTVSELAELVIDLVGSQSAIETLDLPADDPQRRRPDLTLASSQLGWSAKVDLETGLRATIKALSG